MLHQPSPSGERSAETDLKEVMLQEPAGEVQSLGFLDRNFGVYHGKLADCPRVTVFIKSIQPMGKLRPRWANDFFLSTHGSRRRVASPLLSVSQVLAHLPPTSQPRLGISVSDSA